MNSMDFPRPGQRREPALFLPPVVAVIIVSLLAIYGGLLLLGELARDQVYFDWGFVPGRFTWGVAGRWILDLAARSGQDADAENAARLLRDSGALDGGWRPYTLLTYAFLHGSWTHVGVNCVWMAAFGPPVARYFGVVRFLLFYAMGAIAGALAHWTIAPYEVFPLIGASAADSALMAGAARFLFRPPGAAVPGLTGLTGADGARPATLKELLFDTRALIFIAIWMVTNFVFGAGATAFGGAEAPIAWVAHVGGFTAGLLFFGLFDPRGWRRRWEKI